jgi:flagellar biosynthesis GTPase FlhF
MAGSKFISREDKNREIKKALVHRARIRKNYFKLLEKEGIDNEKNTDINHDKPKNKPLNFAERAQKVKQRKQEKRKSDLEQVQERRKQIVKKESERLKRKERIEKRTTRGQPLMGPRINNLLDKIKKDL